MVDRGSSSVDVLIREYEYLGAYVTTVFRLGWYNLIAGGALAIALFSLAILFDKPLLFIISPVTAMAFMYGWMIAEAFVFIVGVRLGQIEDLINKELGSNSFGWEMRGGIFANTQENFIVRNLWGYINKWLVLSALLAFSLITLSLWFGLSWLYSLNPLLAVIIAGLFVLAITAECYWAYSFLVMRKWEKPPKLP